MSAVHAYMKLDSLLRHVTKHLLGRVQCVSFGVLTCHFYSLKQQLHSSGCLKLHRLDHKQ